MKSATKGSTRRARSPVALNNTSANVVTSSRKSPIRAIKPVQSTTTHQGGVSTTVKVISQRPRSGSGRIQRSNKGRDEDDDFLSQSANYASDSDIDNDALKNNKSIGELVNYQKQKKEADLAKGKKSPSNMTPRASTPTNFRSSKTHVTSSNTNVVTPISTNSSNNHHMVSVNYNKTVPMIVDNKDVESALSDLTDTTDTTALERYMGDTSKDNIYPRIHYQEFVDQVPENDIDSLIAALQQKKLMSSNRSELTSNNPVPTTVHVVHSTLPVNEFVPTKHLPVETQPQFFQRRSKSGPPRLPSNAPSLASNVSSQNQTSSHVHQSVYDSDNDEDVQEVIEHNYKDEIYAFIPPATQVSNHSNQLHSSYFHNSKHHLSQRSESEVSYATSNGSLTSTPNFMQKRSPTPLSHFTPQEHQYCPVVERPSDSNSHSQQKPQKKSQKPNPIVTEFVRPVLVRDQSSGIQSPRGSAFDDVSSVTSSSTSSFSVVSNGNSALKR